MHDDTSMAQGASGLAEGPDGVIVHEKEDQRSENRAFTCHVAMLTTNDGETCKSRTRSHESSPESTKKMPVLDIG